MISLLSLLRVHNPVSWSACAQLKGDDTWCGFAFIYGVILSLRLYHFPSRKFRNSDGIYFWHCHCHLLLIMYSLVNKSNDMEMQKRNKELSNEMENWPSQTTFKIPKFGSLIHTTIERTFARWIHDMQIRCKIYFIFMHCKNQVKPTRAHISICQTG